MNRETVVLFAVAVGTTVIYFATAGGTPGESAAPLAAVARVRSASPATGPAPQPTTRPTRIAKSAPLPAAFHVLLRRNLFLGGSTASPSASRSGGPSLPEDQFVLRGIMHQSGTYTALIEDLATHRIRSVVAGDVVARGVLRQVSFDGLEYEAAGKPTQVAIGQKLSGVVMTDPVIAARPTKSGTVTKGEERRGNEKDRERDREREAGKGDIKDRRNDADRSATSLIETGG